MEITLKPKVNIFFKEDIIEDLKKFDTKKDWVKLVFLNCEDPKTGEDTVSLQFYFDSNDDEAGCIYIDFTKKEALGLIKGLQGLTELI